MCTMIRQSPPEPDVPLAIGTVEVPNRVFMAPMSGVTDLPMRQLALRHGAGLVVSEMVASGELVRGSQEAIRRMKPAKGSIHMVQLAGRDPTWMADAARLCADAGADIIDINMGCPAKKVIGGYSGSALMRDLELARRMIAATVAAVDFPVTLKMRLGWDRQTMNAPELAAAAQELGVKMITVHGRTRDQFYEGSADWHAVAAVRERISVPLVVNGDIATRSDAREAMAKSGADAVMVGRAHQGAPWAAGLIAGADAVQQPATPGEVADYVSAHLDMMLDHYGAHRGIRHARKHLGWYIDKVAGDTPPSLRSALFASVRPDEVHAMLRRIFTEFGPATSGQADEKARAA